MPISALFPEAAAESLSICCGFALDFTIDDVTEFFLKVHFECPFNFRDHHEAVYYYSFTNRLKYSEAQRLIDQADSILDTHVPNTPATEHTHMIGAALSL